MHWRTTVLPRGSGDWVRGRSAEGQVNEARLMSEKWVDVLLPLLSASFLLELLFSPAS